MLTGFDLSGFSQNALVAFRTVVNTPTDGQEEFFLIAARAGGSNNIPEPDTVAMLGIGLIGLRYAAGRARNR